MGLYICLEDKNTIVERRIITKHCSISIQNVWLVNYCGFEK